MPEPVTLVAVGTGILGLTVQLARIFHTPFWGGRGAARRG